MVKTMVYSGKGKLSRKIVQEKHVFFLFPDNYNSSSPISYSFIPRINRPERSTDHINR